LREEAAREVGRERQVVWLNSEATQFVVPCDACLADVHSRAAFLLARDTCFEGRLRPEADVGFMTCPRGHRIVVRRAFGPVGARSLRRH
jgi:hypothetical protein